jgi:hypothetical protein
MRIRKTLIIAALLVAIPVLARAQSASRSWTAAQGVLPADLTVVAGVNMNVVRKSQLFTTLFPALIASEADARQTLDTIKASCSIDVVTVVSDFVVAMDKSEKGAIYMALTGVDEKKVTSCLVAVGAKMANAKITAKRTGNIVEYSESGSKDKIYAGWIGTDVLVIALDPEDKALLERMMGGKGVGKTGDMARNIKSVNTGAAVWAAVVQKEAMSGGTMKGGYGSLDLAGGIMNLDGHMVMGSAKEASAAAAEANKQIAGAAGSLGPDMDKVIKAVKVSSAGDELVFKMSISEKDVMTLMGMLMSSM